MDNISAFCLPSKDGSKSINISMSNEGNVSVPLKHSQSHYLTHTLISPSRDIEIIKDVVSDRADVHLIQDDLWRKERRIFTPLTSIEFFSCVWGSESIRFLLVDPFILTPSFIRKLESEISELRAMLAYDGIPCTFSYASSTNNSNWAAYSNEFMTLFDYCLMPMSLSVFDRFDFILTLEGLDEKKDDGALFSQIRRSREYYFDNKKGS